MGEVFIRMGCWAGCPVVGAMPTMMGRWAGCPVVGTPRLHPPHPIVRTRVGALPRVEGLGTGPGAGPRRDAESAEVLRNTIPVLVVPALCMGGCSPGGIIGGGSTFLPGPPFP